MKTCSSLLGLGYLGGRLCLRPILLVSDRVQNAGYSVSRPEGDTGKYKSIPHHHRGEVQFLGRYALLRKSKERQGLDGLNNLNYFANVTYDALYKNITVNLTPELAQVNEY